MYHTEFLKTASQSWFANFNAVFHRNSHLIKWHWHYHLLLQDLHEENCVRIADLEKQVDRAGYEAKARTEMMEDIKESHR